MRTSPAAVEATGLRKSFGPVRAVDGVDLRIEPGEVVALLGPNGAGKSTTIDLLLGLTRPEAGTVRVFGEPPDHATRQGLVGATLQVGGLVDGLTVREMIALVGGLSGHPMPIGEVLALARVTELADRRATKLSGGQTQRVRFALAIAGDPQLLVLDEPTAAMDVGTRRAFWATMRAWTQRGRTVVFATHYLEEADDFADRVILMAKGTVVADGSTTEIKARAGGRTIRCTLPGTATSSLRRMPGVIEVERHGDAVLLRCSDSDAALRALLTAHDRARDIEVSGAGLEDAFLELTHDEAPVAGVPA
jgi:ABC-2 type transport system ATP-binding protein